MENMDKDARSKLVLKAFPPLDQLKGRELDQRARAAGETFVVDDRIKTHQLRNIFSAIEKMRTRYQQNPKYSDDLENELFLLKPKLAYAAGRQRGIRNHLFTFIENAIHGVTEDSAIDKDKAVRNFFALLESVVGYHKYYENQ